MNKLTRKELAALTAEALIQRQRDLRTAIGSLDSRALGAFQRYDELRSMQQAVVRESNRRMDVAA